ncbi:MAG TPA: SDR family NAD(P)-dependent oxidoreductase [Bryobacteraceae bacterium]|nr:SDR family NAD(P)-dependent oxidoreductase [Bryobacteraceae bacterium]
MASPALPSMRIDGKVALVTGASEGIGAACVRALRERGARVALTARSETNLRAVASETDLVIPGDLLVPEDRRRIVETTVDHFGQIDILVNNAGIGVYAPAHSAQMPQVRHMFELNFFAPLEMTQLVIPAMRRHGPGGSIVNVGSIAGKVTLPWFTLYSASKYALGSLTDGLRMELREAGIHAMTVCPGYVKTEFQAHVLAGHAPAALARGRQTFAITPEQCAAAIVRGLQRNARTVLVPRVAWLFVLAERLLPRLTDAQLARIYRGHR